jgi:Tol biopolymer transport system component
LWESNYSKYPGDWSKDGRFILYAENDPQTSFDLWVLSLTGERKAWPWLKTKSLELRARFSPDSKWIAFTANASGRSEVYLRAFEPNAPAAGGQWQISTNG